MDQTNALAIVEQHKKTNALVYINPEDLQTQKMFVPQVTEIHALPTDFHNINGKMMPKSHHTYRIGEAAGVDFLSCDVERIDKTTWVGKSQGRRRLPDGSWRTSNMCHYEFDALLRAEIDSKAKEGREFDKLLLEYRKFGMQRAETGAKSRVIRELVGIPTAFDKQDIARAMVVSRIAVNTDALLDNPETRKLAVDAAMGRTSEVFGPKDVTPEALPAPDGTVTAEIVDDFDDFDQADPLDATKEQRIKLEEWRESDLAKNSKQAEDEINAALGNADSTPEMLDGLIAKLQRYQDRKDKGGAS